MLSWEIWLNMPILPPAGDTQHFFAYSKPHHGVSSHSRALNVLHYIVEHSYTLLLQLLLVYAA